MKIFHAELAVNPGLYSFGYSVYATLEAGDDLAKCYAQGFVPFVGARNLEGPTLYMIRGSRLRAQEFVETTYHHRVARRARDHFNSEVRTDVHEKSSFPITIEFKTFLLKYFEARFGKVSMSADRLDAILASPFLTHIVAYTVDSQPVAYTLETHGSDFVHVWYITYAPEYTSHHLGAYLFLDLARRAKAAGKQFVYFGVTCGVQMIFKTNFQPLEYWSGYEWVRDEKSRELKRLLATDATRAIALTDAWRDTRDPYHPAQVRFTNAWTELRFLAFVLNGLPRVSIAAILGIFFMVLAVLTLHVLSLLGFIG